MSDKRYKHGHANDPTYRTWMAMIQRCTNPNKSNYKYYGGRGIAVCEKWRTFAGFLEDMGERPDGTTIDRINGDAGYSRENCRWASRVVQASNKPGCVRMVTVDGVTTTLSEACRRRGLKIGTVWERLKAGMSDEAALKTPLKRRMTSAEKVCIATDPRSYREIMAEYGISGSYINKLRHRYRKDELGVQFSVTRAA